MSCLGFPRRAAYRLVLVVSLAFTSSSLLSQISLNGNPVNFGNVQVGNSLIKPVALNNSGKTTVTVYKVAVTGTGFSFVGPTLPVTIPSQSTASFSLSFAPQSAANFSGSATASAYASWGGRKGNRYGTITVSLSGTGYNPQAGYLAAPASMNLGSVTVGSSQTQSLTVSNTGGASLTISGATLNGSAYSVSGLTYPYTLAAGASASLSVVFAPTTTGTLNGTLTLASSASDPSVSVSLTGSGTSATGTLTVAPTSLSFGSVTIGTSQALSGSLTASGGNVTLSSDSSSNSAYALSGLTLPMTLSAGQSVPYSVTFAPTAAGASSANLSFFTSSAGSVVQSASGSGATIQHTVNLSWNASTSSISGYNVYRGTSASGPYSKINAALDPAMNYSDSSVQSGKTYYYVTTAVDSAGAESSYSNQVQAVVPFP